MLGRGHVTSRETDAKWGMRGIIYTFIGGLDVDGVAATHQCDPCVLDPGCKPVAIECVTAIVDLRTLC